MRIVNMTIRNYKSIKAVSFAPSSLSVIVGANASGKTNLADCVDFMSEVYRHGLEVAVGRKGGYDNIAFRRIRRSKQPVSLRIDIELTSRELSPFMFHRQEPGPLRLEHSFAFVARGESIRAAFEVISERLTAYAIDQPNEPFATIERSGETFTISRQSRSSGAGSLKRKGQPEGDLLGFQELDYLRHKTKVPKTELLTSILGRVVPGFVALRSHLERIRVFQISPTKSREFGVPTPSPEIDRTGANLPAVVDVMQKRHRQAWRRVMATMRNILPHLDEITVEYTSSRTLGLYFKEHGSGRPWSVDEVSDGTVQTLALLVAIFEQDWTTLVLEEPENSVHPWIIRHIIDACRDASKRKQIVLTTHSPIVIDAVRPEQVWVIWKRSGQSHLAPLSTLDPDFLPMWRSGEIPTFAYLDSGAVQQALPLWSDDKEDEDQ